MKRFSDCSLTATSGRSVFIATAWPFLTDRASTPTFIDRVQDRNGYTLFRQDQRHCPDCRALINPDGSVDQESTINILPPMVIDDRKQILDPVVAYQMTSIMEGVIRRGTARSANSLNRTLAGKTGTTDDSFDAWFVGFSADLVAGVYIGFDTPATLGKRETGSSVALPAWIEFMQHALSGHPDVPFRRPNGISLVKIDSKTGFLPGPDTPASRIIFEAFRSGTEPRTSSLNTPSSSDGADTVPDFSGGGIY
jgi:penicillin-binding protein 1A